MIKYLKILSQWVVVFVTLWFVFSPFEANAQEEEKFNFGVHYKYLENERMTEETNASEVFQKRVQRDAGMNLDYYIHLNGAYKGYESITQVGIEENRLTQSQSKGSGWLPLFDFIYFSGLTEDSKNDYTYLVDQTPLFYEDEKTKFTSQGFGLFIKDFKLRVGVNPNAVFSWEYNVKVSEQILLAEKIDYKLDVYEIIKNPVDLEGIFFDLYYKKMVTKDQDEETDGKMEGTRRFVKTGFGFTSSSRIYGGGHQSSNLLNALLLTQQSRLYQESEMKQTFYGMEVEINEYFSFMVEKIITNEMKTFESIIYKSTRDYKEEGLTIGITLNKRIQIKLESAKTHDFRQTEIVDSIYEPSIYRLFDDLIGVTIRFRFSG